MGGSTTTTVVVLQIPMSRVLRTVSIRIKQLAWVTLFERRWSRRSVGTNSQTDLLSGAVAHLFAHVFGCKYSLFSPL